MGLEYVLKGSSSGQFYLISNDDNFPNFHFLSEPVKDGNHIILRNRVSKDNKSYVNGGNAVYGKDIVVIGTHISKDTEKGSSRLESELGRRVYEEAINFANKLGVKFSNTISI